MFFLTAAKLACHCILLLKTTKLTKNICLAMDHIYHGCAYANDDGSRKLIAINDKCLISNNQCFWKDTRNTCVKVKTRTMASSEKTTPLKIINNYFKDKEKDNAII